MSWSAPRSTARWKCKRRVTLFTRHGTRRADGHFNGPTLTLEIRNTAYGLVQTGTHFLDHIRGFRSQETYLHRSILTEESLKAKLMPLVRRVAEEDRELVVPV